MTRLYLVRHADAYDAEGFQLEHYGLSNTGKIQALQLAKRLKENKFDAMYCSEVKRSIETCEIVNEYHKLQVKYMSELNEVGSEAWPQPGAISGACDSCGIEEFAQAVRKIHKTYRKILSDNKSVDDKGREVIIFTHGNWIRVLLAKILSNGMADTFVHFVIHNTSLTIIDVDEKGFGHIITVSDAAHTQLYDTRI